MLTDTVTFPVIPAEIMTARLICLNKKPDELGKEENIRPIAINGVMLKIMEFITNKKLNVFLKEHSVLCKKQIGFMKGLGCEVNLVRLRQKVTELLVKKILVKSSCFS